jgi:hypothetical protein
MRSNVFIRNLNPLILGDAPPLPRRAQRRTIIEKVGVGKVVPIPVVPIIITITAMVDPAVIMPETAAIAELSALFTYPLFRNPVHFSFLGIFGDGSFI